MIKYQPVCQKCEAKIGFREQLGAWNMGDHWLCTAHRFAELQRRGQEQRDYLSTGGATVLD